MEFAGKYQDYRNNMDGTNKISLSVVLCATSAALCVKSKTVEHNH
jgi:hypothetical protein